MKKDYKHNGEHYCSVVNVNSTEEGLSFITSDDKSIQVGIWNYKKNKLLKPHFHNIYERSAQITSESVYVVKGKVLSKVYDLEKNIVCEVTLETGDMIIQFSGIHEYEILEDSIVIENKNGPYLGEDIDRTRVQIEEN